MQYHLVCDNIAYPGKGQDCVVTGNQPSREPAIAVLADGISSSPCAEIGAQAACKEALRVLSEMEYGAVMDKDFYRHLYKGIVTSISDIASNEQADAPIGFATTLITAVVDEGSARFSYCGNGAIFHIRRQWFDLPEELVLPWGINNYLNPHTLFMAGDNKLYKSLKPGQEINRWSPDLVALETTDGALSYFLICSDGLYSSDESLPFWDETKTNIYHSENQRLLLFLQLLRKYHAAGWPNRELFSKEFSQIVAERNLLTDDLSYALFIPAQ